MTRMINFFCISKLVPTEKEGQYETFTSRNFRGNEWTEGKAVRTMEQVSPELPLNMVVIPVTCSEENYETVRDSQSGNAAEGEPAEMSIVDGTAFYADTGEAVPAAGLG